MVTFFAIRIAYISYLCECGGIKCSESRALFGAQRSQQCAVAFQSARILHRLLEACDQSESAELGLAVRLALFTGMRQADVMGLQWGRVNLGDLPITYTDELGRMFTIPPRHCLVTVTKNGSPHLAPLEGVALESLKAWRLQCRSFDPNRLVFPGRHNSYQPLDLRTPWKTALKRAGIDGFRWHDLRHSFASMMLKTGASHIELAKLTGHKDLRSLMRYTHIAPEHSGEDECANHTSCHAS